MLGDPKKLDGIWTWALLGLGGAIVALLIAYLFPTIIPAKAAAVKL